MLKGKVTTWCGFGLLALVAAAAAYRCVSETYRLVFLQAKRAGIDLRLRHEEVVDWFAGLPIYEFNNSAVYPPASYVMMWPLVGLGSFAWARWVWAVSTAVLLGFIIRTLLKEPLYESTREKIFWSLVILAHYATGITIGNGQLTIHLFAAILGFSVYLRRVGNPWVHAGVIGVLAALALVKPTSGTPFIWLVLFVPRSLYPILATIGVYAVLALIGAAFQERDVVELYMDWLVLGMDGAAWSSSAEAASDTGGTGVGDKGYGDVHTVLSTWGLSHLALYVSLSILFAAGVWVWLHRYCNLLVLLGVVAIVSRVWTYHRVYDDMIILFAVFGVLASLKLGLNPKLDRLGRPLLGLLLFASLIPATLRLMEAPLGPLFTAGQPALWMVTLGYLAHTAYIQRVELKHRTDE